MAAAACYYAISSTNYELISGETEGAAHGLLARNA